MAETKERTLGYRRADWLIENPASINLGSLVKQALGKLKTIEDRTIVRPNDQLMKLVMSRGSADGFLLHITLETPGEAASIVPSDTSAEEIDVGTADPPDGSEFMDGDAFLYIKKNNVVLCSTGLQDATIRDFLSAFFEKAALRKDSDKFDLVKVASISALKLLMSQGVEEIELRAATYWATAHYLQRKHQPQGLLGEITKLMKTLLGTPNDANPDALTVMLTLKADKRRNGLVLGYKRMKEIGASVLKNYRQGDDFTIVTRAGQRIGPNEIYMRSTVRIQAQGKSVVREKAWKELQTFYNSLQEAGALEQ